MRAGVRVRRLHDEAEARVDRRWAGGPRFEGPPLPRPGLRRLRYMMAEGRRGELDLVDLLHDFFSVLLAYAGTHVFSVGSGTRLERAKRGWFGAEHAFAVEDPIDVHQCGEWDAATRVWVNHGACTDLGPASFDCVCEVG